MWKALISLVEKWACRHKWETLREIEIVNENDVCIGHRYYFVCKKCGKIEVK